MPRSGKFKDKRFILPDLIFNRKFVARLINTIMRNGKKRLAQRMVYEALSMVGSNARRRWQAEKRNSFLSDMPEQHVTERKNFCHIDLNSSIDVTPLDNEKLSYCLLLYAVKNVQPFVEVRSKRVGGSTHQIPTAIDQKRSQSMAIRWIRSAAIKRSAKFFSYALAQEILDACDKQGGAFKKCQDVFKMARGNQAFLNVKVDVKLFES